MVVDENLENSKPNKKNSYTVVGFKQQTFNLGNLNKERNPRAGNLCVVQICKRDNTMYLFCYGSYACHVWERDSKRINHETIPRLEHTLEQSIKQ